MEQYAIGEDKVSITITRKTVGDRVVSQYTSERWFKDESSAILALRKVMETVTDMPPANGGDEPEKGGIVFGS